MRLYILITLCVLGCTARPGPSQDISFEGNGKNTAGKTIDMEHDILREMRIDKLDSDKSDESDTDPALVPILKELADIPTGNDDKVETYVDTTGKPIDMEHDILRGIRRTDINNDESNDDNSDESDDSDIDPVVVPTLKEVDNDVKDDDDDNDDDDDDDDNEEDLGGDIGFSREKRELVAKEDLSFDDLETKLDQGESDAVAIPSTKRHRRRRHIYGGYGTCLINIPSYFETRQLRINIEFSEDVFKLIVSRILW